MSKSSSILLPRHANDGQEAFYSKITSISEFEPTLTQQHQAAECDINTILNRWTQTGVAPQNLKAPQYGDFSHVADFHSSLNTVIEAQALFNSMDYKVRARFGNDPGAMIDFLLDPTNKAEAIKLGLCTPTEDLSTGGASADHSAGDAPTVRKSGQSGKTSKTASNEASGGTSGDE